MGMCMCVFVRHEDETNGAMYPHLLSGGMGEGGGGGEGGELLTLLLALMSAPLLISSSTTSISPFLAAP